MQQQFEHLQPDFIAVHDVATASSRTLLAGIAAASSASVQKLVIRRQGYGMALATLEFVELPAANGQLLRLYTTEVDADTAPAPCAGARAARLQPARRGHGRRPAAARARRGAEAAARGHPRRPVAEPQPAAAAAVAARRAARSGLDLGRRHRRAGVARAAGGQAGRRLDLHQRYAGTGCAATRRPSRRSATQSALAPARRRTIRSPFRRRCRPAARRRPSRCRCSRCRRRVPRARSPTDSPTTRGSAYVRQCSELNGMISCCVFELATPAHAGPCRRAPGPGARWPRRALAAARWRPAQPPRRSA